MTTSGLGRRIEVAQLDPTFAGLGSEDGGLTVVTTGAADLDLTTLRSAITSVLGDPRLQTARLVIEQRPRRPATSPAGGASPQVPREPRSLTFISLERSLFSLDGLRKT
jgi:hypothetical protein